MSGVGVWGLGLNRQGHQNGFLRSDAAPLTPCRERGFFIDNLLVRIHCIIKMIWWTGLAPWEFEFPFPGGLVSTFLMTPCTSPSPPIYDTHTKLLHKLLQSILLHNPLHIQAKLLHDLLTPKYDRYTSNYYKTIPRPNRYKVRQSPVRLFVPRRSPLGTMHG